MSAVETVRGPVDCGGARPDLMHEHVFVLQPEALQNYGHVWGASYWDEEERVADAIEKLRAVRAAGIQTIVDPTAPGLGRFIPRIQRINAEVDLNIIVATGFYAFLELPNFLAYRSDDAIAELFVREIREGIDDTGVRAAFIKCAVERHGIVGDVPRILGGRRGREPRDRRADHGAHELRGAGRAACALGADKRGCRPVADRHRSCGRQQRSRVSEGDRGHRGDPGLRPLQHRALQSGRAAHRDTRSRCSQRVTRDRIHLSHDAACFYDFMVGDPYFADERPDYLHISRRILPALLEAGVTQEQIDEMMIENPRRYFDP